MAESSFLWTTDGTGDGTATGYTQANASDILEIVSQCFGRNGVAANYLNSLAPSTTGANNARIATGGGLVDGKPYKNTANVDVTIPSAVGGGNTRIDRVVLRASWAAQTVRITRIAGTDAASPTAPAITQTSGTTYDVLLCQALVDTSGNVTITDERTLAQVDTSEIADGGVSTAKLANDSVDDTKAGNRVPQFYRRQGGNAAVWLTPGTTDYTPTAVRMQAGAISIDGSGTVNFPVAFSNTPLALLTCRSADRIAYVFITSTTSLSIYVTDLAGNTAADYVIWLAIGPE